MARPNTETLNLRLSRRLVIQIRVLAALRRVPIEEWLAEHLAPILGNQLPQAVRLLYEANRTMKVDLVIDALAAAGDITKGRYRAPREANLIATLDKELGPLLQELAAHQPPSCLRGAGLNRNQPSGWRQQQPE